MAQTLAAPKTQSATKVPKTIGAVVDKAFELNLKKKEAQKVVDAIDEEIKALEEVIFERLDAQETTTGAGKKASVSITKSVVPSVTDWDALWAFIAKKKHFHIVQKRLSAPAVRELWDLQTTVPGIQPFTKRVLHLNTLSSSK